MTATIDQLEPRRLMAASLLRVRSITADNRGEILVQFTERATGVKGAAFQVYTAGADGKLYTSDDQRESVGFTYSKGKKLLRIVANLAPNTPYRLKLDGKTRIRKEDDGSLLDGDFVAGNRASGDGVAGGNYEMQVKPDTSATKSAVIHFNAGDVVIQLRGDKVPTTVNNFITYLDNGSYDGTFIHRNGRTQSYPYQLPILQGGSEKLVNGTVTDIPTFSPIPLEAILPNDEGTLAMARQSDPDTATSGFFINVTDDPALDSTDPQGKLNGYTVFAKITSGLSLIQTIYNNPTGVLTSQYANVPTYNGGLVTIRRAAVLGNVVSKKG